VIDWSTVYDVTCGEFGDNLLQYIFKVPSTSRGLRSLAVVHPRETSALSYELIRMMIEFWHLTKEKKPARSCYEK
jgi:hypothetical protein